MSRNRFLVSVAGASLMRAVLDASRRAADAGPPKRPHPGELIAAEMRAPAELHRLVSRSIGLRSQSMKVRRFGR